MTQWIICILIGAFMVNMVNMMLPDTKLKPYINLVCNFIFVFIVISPVISVISDEGTLEDKILESINSYNQKYLESNNDSLDKSNNLSLNKSYEENLKSVLKLKLEQYGYELEDIELEGVDIKSMKIKESNNDNNIEVFNENKDENRKNLKDDLIKIFNISIDKIEID